MSDTFTKQPINKCFYSLSDAEEHYYEVSNDDHGCDIALIEDYTSKEVVIYSVISEDTLRCFERYYSINFGILKIKRPILKNLYKRKSDKIIAKRYRRKLHKATNLHNKTEAIKNQ